MSGFSLVATLVVAIGSRYIVRCRVMLETILREQSGYGLERLQNVSIQRQKNRIKKSPRRAIFFMYDVPIGLVNLSALHSVLVVLLINEDILLIRVDMTFLCLIHDITKGYYIGDQCK